MPNCSLNDEIGDDDDGGGVDSSTGFASCTVNKCDFLSSMYGIHSSGRHSTDYGEGCDVAAAVGDSDFGYAIDCGAGLEFASAMRRMANRIVVVANGGFVVGISNYWSSDK